MRYKAKGLTDANDFISENVILALLVERPGFHHAVENAVIAGLGGQGVLKRKQDRHIQPFFPVNERGKRIMIIQDTLRRAVLIGEGNLRREHKLFWCGGIPHSVRIGKGFGFGVDDERARALG